MKPLPWDQACYLQSIVCEGRGPGASGTIIQSSQGPGAKAGEARGQLQPLLLCPHPRPEPKSRFGSWIPPSPRRPQIPRSCARMAAGFAFLPSSAVCAPQTVAPPPHKAAPPGPPLRPCCSAGGPVDPPKSGAPARSSSVTPGHLGCGRCSSRPVQGRRGLLCWGLNRDPPQPPLSRCPLRMGWGLPSRRRSPPGRRPFRGGGSRPRPGPDLEAARSVFVWGGDVRVFLAPERPAAGSKLFGTLPGPRGTGRWGRFCPERLVGEDD